MRKMLTTSMAGALVPALLLAATPVIAQTQNGSGAGAPPPAREAVIGTLTSRAAGLTMLRSYLDVPPRELVGRVDGLLNVLREQIETTDPQTLIAALDRIAEQSRATLNAANVTRLVVDPSFVPTRTLIALDFGAPGTPPAQGFARVAPGDSRLAGALSTPQPSGENGIQADGISGLKRVTLKVPGEDAGPYRILIATRNPPNADFRNSFFGTRIEVSGGVSEVRKPVPSQWLSFAMLSAPSGGTVRPAADGGMLRTGTFGQGQLDDAARAQGGAIVLEAYAVDGELDIQLPGDVPAFVTALMVERADQPSEFVLTPEARTWILSLEERLAIEAEIQALIAALLAEIPPAAGPDQQLNDLPDPVFLSDLTASPS